MKTGRAIAVAFKNLTRNRLRSFLMMIGIVIGITALTMIVSAGVGARDRVMERVKKFGLESMMVLAGGGIQPMRQQAAGEPTTTLTLEDAVAMQQEIRAIAGVSPSNQKRQAEVTFRDRSATTTVVGVTPPFVSVWDWDVATGEFITDEDMASLARVCIVGPTVQRVLFGESTPLGEQVRIGNVQCEIKGVMRAKGASPGGGDMDDRIYMPLSTLMRRVVNVDYVSGIKVRLTTARELDSATAAIRALLRERHKLAAGTPDDFTIVTPTEITKMAEKVTGTFNILLALVAAVSLVAGGVVVANIMLVSVNERRKEIGLRKAVGARSRDIMLQFLYEATAVTLSGGLVGIGLGAVGVRVLEAVTDMPTSISWESLALGVVSSSLVGLIAGLQPARKAAAMLPIEALRT